VIRCPASWADLGPRVELNLLVETLPEHEVRVLARIAACLLRGTIHDRSDVPRAEVEDFLVEVAGRWLRQP
jgi:hypothetical protein